MYSFFLNKTIREATEVTLVSVQDISRCKILLYSALLTVQHIFI